MSALLSHVLDVGRYHGGVKFRAIDSLGNVTPREKQFLRGELIDVSTIACWVGLRIPTALTSEVWTTCFGKHYGPPTGLELKQYEERIWQVLRSVQDVLRRLPGARRICTVELDDDILGKITVTLTVRLSVGERGEAVLTVSNPVINDD